METVGLVSIVIVGHNDWPDLELAIQSALCQSYPKIEVIVVDNSSKDATEQEVPRLFGNRITYVRQANTGEGGGRNVGMRLAAGEFVQFLDGDDCLAPDKVEKQIAVLNTAPEVDIVYGDVRQFQTSAGRANWEDWDTTDYPDMLATLLSFDGNGGGLIPDSLIFRQRALERIGPWVENPPSSDGAVQPYVGADQDYWLRAAWSGCRFRYCPGSLCFYRKRSGQLTSNLRGMARGEESVFTRARQYITTEPYKTAVSKRLSYLLFFLAVSEREGDLIGSLTRLRKAREVSPGLVTLPAFAMGAFLIITRIGPFVFSARLRPIRLFGARWLRMEK